jgi:hypothetical protein
MGADRSGSKRGGALRSRRGQARWQYEIEAGRGGVRSRRGEMRWRLEMEERRSALAVGDGDGAEPDGGQTWRWGGARRRSEMQARVAGRCEFVMRKEEDACVMAS